MTGRGPSRRALGGNEAEPRVRFAALAGLLVLGCAQPASTQILVVSDTDMRVPDQLSVVRFRVMSPQGEVQSAAADFGAGEPRPAVLSLDHRGGPFGPFFVDVEGERAPGETVRLRSARVYFQRGRVVVLRMDLLQRCGDVVCTGDETCGGAGCRPIAVDPSELSAWTGAAAGLDASVADGGGGRSCALDADCDDEVACTQDVCRGGYCVSAADDAACPTDAVDCTLERCDATRGCVSMPDDGACDDGVSCTADRCDTTRGCVSTPDDGACDDGVGCTADRCDASMGCVSAPDAGACDDGIGCTVDACDAVTGCMSTPDDGICDDGIGCTLDACDPGRGCASDVDHGLCPVGQYCDGSLGSGCATGPTFTEVYAMLGSECGSCHTSATDGGLESVDAGDRLVLAGRSPFLLRIERSRRLARPGRQRALAEDQPNGALRLADAADRPAALVVGGRPRRSLDRGRRAERLRGRIQRTEGVKGRTSHPYDDHATRARSGEPHRVPAALELRGRPFDSSGRRWPRRAVS